MPACHVKEIAPGSNRGGAVETVKPNYSYERIKAVRCNGILAAFKNVCKACTRVYYCSQLKQNISLVEAMAENGSNHLAEILLTLHKGGVDFIVCGGVALVLQGVERLTMDIDLSVDMDESNLKKFLAAMRSLKLKPRAPVPAESLMDPEARRMFVEEKNALVFTFHDPDSPFRQVDIFITDSLSFDTLKHDTETVMINNQPTKVLSRSKLLELKQAIRPPREKDLFDIQMLRKLLKESEQAS